MKISIIYILFAIFIGGCVPIPHYRVYSPTISGEVTQNGVPVENAIISISSRFIEDTQTTVTDDTGHFTLKPIKKFSFLLMIIGDPLFSYTTQIVVDNKNYEAGSNQGIGYVPNNIQLNCDLSHPIHYSKSKQVYCK